MSDLKFYKNAYKQLRTRCIETATWINYPPNKGEEMQIAGKEIKDECSRCGNILECKLFRQGHGIKQERENIAKMIECQMKHREEREK